MDKLQEPVEKDANKQVPEQQQISSMRLFFDFVCAGLIIAFFTMGLCGAIVSHLPLTIVGWTCFISIFVATITVNFIVKYRTKRDKSANQAFGKVVAVSALDKLYKTYVQIGSVQAVCYHNKKLPVGTDVKVLWSKNIPKKCTII